MAQHRQGVHDFCRQETSHRGNTLTNQPTSFCPSPLFL